MLITNNRQQILNKRIKESKKKTYFSKKQYLTKKAYLAGERELHS